MPSDRLEGVALVTGGGRGIGASIARELGWSGHEGRGHRADGEQVEAVAAEIGGCRSPATSPTPRRRRVGAPDRGRARADRAPRRERRAR